MDIYDWAPLPPIAKKAYAIAEAGPSPLGLKGYERAPAPRLREGAGPETALLKAAPLPPPVIAPAGRAGDVISQSTKSSRATRLAPATRRHGL